jgi:hypothetical protein
MPTENEKEIALLGDAIAATDRELFIGAATGKDDEEIVHDETGDRTREGMGDGLEGQVEAEEPEEAEADADAETSEKGGDAEADEEADTEAEGDKKPKPDREVDGKFAAKEGADKTDVAADKGNKDGRVPPGRLREETQKRVAAEAERDEYKAKVEAGQREFAQLSAKLDQAVGRIDEISRRPAGDVAKPAADTKTEAPDIFSDPAAFIAQMQKPLLDRIDKLSQSREVDRAELSMRTARGEHKEVFDRAYEALGKLDPKNPDQFAIGSRIARSADPGQALVDWYRQDQVLREVGNDPAAYREKIAKDTREALLADPEFRKAVVAELNGEARGGKGGRQNNITRLPKSLNDAAGGSSAQRSAPSDDSERGVFEDAMSATG